MDAEIERIATAMKIASLWDNTLFVFAADNGGPPCKPQRRPLRALSSLCVRGALRKNSQGRLWLSCWRCPPDVANSNYPMRGGKWTIWCVDQRSAIHHSPHALINPRLELYSAALPSQPLTFQCCWAAGREGGTHLTAFAHGVGLPAKVFTGLMHHCDWVATIVEGAAGGKLLPDGEPKLDS